MQDVNIPRCPIFYHYFKILIWQYVNILRGQYIKNVNVKISGLKYT